MSSTINVLNELERNGIQYKYLNADEVGVKCPFHEDGSPSCHVNLEKAQFICRATQCGEKGDIIALLARYLKSTRKVVMEDLGKRYTLNNEATVNVSVVEKYHNRIWIAKPLLKELYKRGMTDENIRKYRWGEWQGRITIPVKNESGDYVNIRSYLPGAPGADKMKNLKGRGSRLRLYPWEQMAYNKIVICGGEAKAICAANMLNQHGYGCVCATAGEGNWQQYLNFHFQGKEVWVMMDIDEAGIAATEVICRHLKSVAYAVHAVSLPLDIAKHPKGDVNDFWAEKGDLHEVIKTSPVWEPKTTRRYGTEEPEVVTLTQASHADVAGKRIKFTATVTTLDTSPYTLPKEVLVRCTRDQNECGICPVSTEPESKLWNISAESAALLEMADERKAAQQFALKDEFNIPSTCMVCKFEPQTFYNIEDARLSPQLQVTERNNEKALQAAYCVGDGLELNETYEFVGRMHPHPKTQQSTLMLSKYKATADALSSYELDLDTLQMFQPSEWTVQGIEAKLTELYEDFEANVTGIFQRRNIHLFCDLAYHSPLFIKFDNKEVKGWVEVLIVGDSSQGKSDVMLGLQRHYQLGEKVECKNATPAGLLGGLQQFGSRWFVTWGVIPTHDRRLVWLEELKGCPIETFAKLTDMRSSGIAELDKIEKRRTMARTRLVVTSNPRSTLSIDRYNFGLLCIPELIGNLEDVRRFDACLIVERSEVDASVINAMAQHRPNRPHKFEKQQCRELILWAWTAKTTLFDSAAESAVLEWSQQFCEKFDESIPIVDRGSMRYKLARLSAALACRTFSHYEGEVLVRRCHVDYIGQMLMSVYTAKAFGYDDYTEAQKANTELIEPDQIERRINETPFPEDIRKSILHTDKIELTDLIDWTAWDRGEAQQFLSFLVRKHALTREKRCYRKTSAFITLLKKMQLENRPSHIKEEF